jgi:cytidylate kinase
MITIAIDGPSAAGKSTVAKGVAKKLGYVYVDTGAMYRCVAVYCHKEFIDVTDEEAVAAVLENIDIELCIDGRVLLNGEDVTSQIRTKEVDKLVSPIANNVKVRSFLVDRQRKMANDVSIVMDGRDIGTVVLPNADVKIFQVADVHKRAERRYAEKLANGEETTLEEVEKELERRDLNDSSRSTGALKPAEDSITVDTSDMTIEESINAILEIVKEKVGQ